MKIGEGKLREIVRQVILKESRVGRNLDSDIQTHGIDWVLEKGGRDLAAVYLSLPVEVPIEEVMRKMRLVKGALRAAPADVYESDPSALEAAMRQVGLGGSDPRGPSTGGWM
jgi:hypothetical protein